MTMDTLAPPKEGESAASVTEAMLRDENQDAFGGVSIVFAGELGSAVAAASDKANLLIKDDNDNDVPGTSDGTEEGGNADIDAVIAELMGERVAKPAPSDEGGREQGKATGESERGLSAEALAALTDDEIGKLLDDRTLRRILGPRNQGTRDKAYNEGLQTGYQRAAQELAVAMAQSEGRDLSPEARAKAQQSLRNVQVDTVNSFTGLLQTSVQATVDRFGLDEGMLDLARYADLPTMFAEIVDAATKAEVESRVKPIAERRAKEMLKASLTKLRDTERTGRKSAPDAAPLLGQTPVGSGIRSMKDADAARASGKITPMEYAKWRTHFGVQ